MNWRTKWKPQPDVTAWELAVDRQHVNDSGIVSDHELPLLGTALRHRTTVLDGIEVRMSEVCELWCAELAHVAEVQKLREALGRAVAERIWERYKGRRRGEGLKHAYPVSAHRH